MIPYVRYSNGLIVAALMFTMSAHAQLASKVLTPYVERVDASVGLGLDYLAEAQKKNGTYDGDHGKTAGVVALAGMAFLSAGHTPGYGPHAETINRCIEYCLGVQTEKGYMGSNSKGGGKMYSHTIATLFLLEVSGMVPPELQQRVDTAIAKAVKIIVAAQQIDKNEKHQGGWRYSPNAKDSDFSCTGWAVMALRSARLNGARVPDKCIDDAVDYVKRHQDKTLGSFGYQDTRKYDTTLTGAGLLCLELMGYHGDKRTFRAGDHILEVFHRLPQSKHFVYGLYYTAQGTFQLGTKYWETFGPWMYDYWIPKQKENGSWDNSAYRTAMSVLAFTVPYRQLPIYQRDETVDEEPE